MNPCPCGHCGDRSGRCRCTPERIARYRGRISGPLADRIDIKLEVPAPREAELVAPVAGEASDSDPRAACERARAASASAARQAQRAARHARDRPALRHRPRRRPAAAPCARAAAAFRARLSPRAARGSLDRRPRRERRHRRRAHRRGDPVPAPRCELLDSRCYSRRGWRRTRSAMCRAASMSCARFCARSTSATADRAWFVGDLVNRGPKSLEVLRFVRDLGARAVTVLGNHDLHLVAQYEGVEKRRERHVPGRAGCARRGRARRAGCARSPMMHVEGGYAMVHAGLLPQWSIARAQRWEER